MRRQRAVVLATLLMCTGPLGRGEVPAIGDEAACPRDRPALETTGDDVLTVFIDTNYGADCNISTPKSIQELATALFVVQNLNKLEYVPGITIGLRVYDTCGDRSAVYRRALRSALEIDCASRRFLGLLAPERLLEALRGHDVLTPLAASSYAGEAELRPALVDILVDFLASRHPSVDLLLGGTEPLLGRFLEAARQAGVCVRSDGEGPSGPRANGTGELVVVALGDYEDVAGWSEDELAGEEDGRRVSIVVPMDNSRVDDLLPEGSYVIEPERYPLELGIDDDETGADPAAVPASAIASSPHLLGVGRAIVEIARALKETRSRSCDLAAEAAVECAPPPPPPQRFDSKGRRPMGNAELYETLGLPKSQSIRYIVSRKIDGAMSEVAAYQIDATSDPYRATAEKDQPRSPLLCVKKLEKNCQDCANFKVQREDKVEEEEKEEKEDNSDTEEEAEERIRTLKPFVWVPIFLTIVSCGTLACLVVLAFLIYRFLADSFLDGNPLLTVVLTLATIFMLQSIVPFCLDDRATDAQRLNARKIFVSSLSFGLAFSVMLTRAVFLAFSTRGVLSAQQHINGYLQGLMLLFMAGVELAISSMFFALHNGDSARIMRSPAYVTLLTYDIFLLALLFAVCCFIAQVRRNYNEGACFFGTAIGMVVCWAIWLTCFLLMSADKRDLIVCYGMLGTASLIIAGVLLPRTYFMCSYSVREKGHAGVFEPADLGPDPRMNNAARQAFDLQSRRQPLYEYVAGGGGDPQQQRQQQQQQQAQTPTGPSSANYYGSGSPRRRSAPRHKRSPEPRRAYSNYGFRPEMREVQGAAYVVPRVNVEDSDPNTTITGEVYLDDDGPAGGAGPLRPGARAPEAELSPLPVRRARQLPRDGALRGRSTLARAPRA